MSTPSFGNIIPEQSASKLRKRLFIYSALMLLLVLALLSVALSETMFSYMKKREAGSLVDIATMRSLGISEWRKRAEDLAKQVTSRSRIRQELEKYNLGEIDLQQLESFTKPKLQDAVKLSTEIVDILRLDAIGKVVTGCGFESKDFLKTYDISGFVHKVTTLSEPLIINNHPVIIASAPIINRNGKYQGSDLVFLDLDHLKGIATNPDKIGKTGEVTVGYHSNDSLHPLFQPGSQGELNSKIFESIKPYLSMAISGKSGIATIGSTELVYQSIDNSNWGLVATQNTDELYLPVYAEMKSIIYISIAIYFIILIGLWLLIKPLAGKILLHTSELERRIQERTADLEREVDQRKRSEAALQKSEEEYRLLAENSSDVIFVLDISQQSFKYISPAIYRLRGLTVEEALNENMNDALTPESLELVTGNINRDVARLIKNPDNPLYSTTEVRQPHKNGSLVWVEISTRYRVNDSGEVELIGVSRNIDERKQAEEALKNSKNRANALLSAIPDLMFRLNDEGVYLDYRADEKDLYVSEPKSIIGRRSRDIAPPAISNLVDKNISETLESGEMQTFEYNLTLPEHGTRDYEARMVKSGDDEVITIVRDITKRKQLEEQLRESQRLEAIGTMVGGVAHEFNNALQSLFLYAGIVKDQLPEKQAIRDNFEHLLDTANDAKHLVEQVMLISTLDSGHSESIVLSELINDVLDQKMAAGLNASKIELTLAEGCPPLVADKQQIRTVLINVIDNAILAIANGGEISVTLEYNEPATEKAIQPKRVQLTITDTGVGMTEATLSQVFNPFFTTREVGQGKGFGLPIVYNILQNMGASISATSVFGEGSSFTIEFPLGNIPEN